MDAIEIQYWTSNWQGIYISEELRTLEKSQKIENVAQTQIDDYQKEPREINTKIWFAQRDINRCRLRQPGGAYIRKACLLQEHEPKALETAAKDICKSNGGCCAYSRGCCPIPRNTVREGLWEYHCSDECGCWLRRRGFRLHIKPLQVNVMDFDDKRFRNVWICYTDVNLSLAISDVDFIFWFLAGLGFCHFALLNLDRRISSDIQIRAE